jgi:hypothetical protein
LEEQQNSVAAKMTHDVSKLALSSDVHLDSLQEAKEKAESDAIEKVTKATLQGIKNGEQASLKLHQDAKNQSEEQTAVAIEKLKNKFDSTKAQVIDIVQNFGNIRADL